jgi:hypothetical protein
MGSFEVQVFVSLIVVLGVAMVALICDYLKGSNERLRERNAELRARQEELEQLVGRLHTQQNAMRAERKSETPRERPVRQLAPAVAAVAEAVLASAGAAPVLAAARSEAPQIEIPKREVPVMPEPAVAMAAAGVTVASAASKPRRTVRTFGFDLNIANEIVSRHVGKTIEQITREMAAPAAALATKPAAVAAAPAEAKRNVVALPAASPAPVYSSISEVQVPGGHFDAEALDRLVAAHGIFRGLVVVVSVATRGELEQESRVHYDRLMNSITRTVRSLGRDQDFTARSAEDEFVLIFPRETGTQAQRRIQQVSERLWDFQLRALGAYSVIFSWGAEESAAETLASLIESARAQIRESRAAEPEAPLVEAAAN